MNLISKDIEKEKLLMDCAKLDIYRGENMNITRVVNICIEEEMELEDMQQMIFDNCEVIQEVIIAIDYLRSKGRLAAADIIEENVLTRVGQLPMKYIRQLGYNED